MLVAVPAFFCAAAAHAQDIQARIKVVSPTQVVVEGKFLTPKYAADKNWTFLQRYADVQDLGRRIDKLQLFDEGGVEVAVKKFAPGVYEASATPLTWRYEVNVGLLDEPTSAAHVSWLTEDRGLLMLEDLLPKFAKTSEENTVATVFIELPQDWNCITNEKRFDTYATGADYLVQNTSQAIFAVGRKSVVTDSFAENPKVALVTDSRAQWQFTTGIQTVSEVLVGYEKTLGAPSNPNVRVFLFPFPKSVEHGRWRAETRGSNVVIISSLMPFQSQGLNRFREQLRHELLHVWLPNDLRLSKNYDWFFEGFVLYHSLKTGAASRQIRFSDYLNTLTQANSLSISERKDLSLIEASARRWDGNFTYINSRAMVVAFLCDVAILRASKGKRSLTDVLQEVYAKHGPGKPVADGNTAVLTILKARPELAGIVAKYIEGKSPIDLAAELADSGIETRGEGSRAVLKLAAKPNGRQRNVLVKLGLNPSVELP